MTVNLSLVVALILIVGLLLRHRGLKGSHAVVAIWLGVLLKDTSLAGPIQEFTVACLRMISQFHL
ncbi:hypothetical protein ACFU99_11135 [Streptomyces sp. NPDC057654]|uniref:hypothetical protein n=1 Tax=Streptomyces sp. NPDC057654 TaxID=3346196 RepID=UPI0036A52901